MSQFLQSCIGIAVLIAGAAYGYGLWKDRKDGSKINAVKLFKDQVDGMELKMKTQAEDIEKLTEQIKELKEEIEKKDKKLADVLEILQGKDPLTQAFTKRMFEVADKAAPLMLRLEKYLDKQSF